jgi:hypothetical protein
MLNRIGFWAFIVGFIVAIVAGFVAPENTAVVIILIVLGLIIGFLNISARETMLFLLATIALIVAGGVFLAVWVSVKLQIRVAWLP